MENSANIQAEVAKQLREQIKAEVEPLKEKIHELEREIQLNPLIEKIAELEKQMEKN